MSIKYINNITSSKHSWPDYGAKIKDNPTSDMVPITPNRAPLLIIRKGHIVTTTFLVELPLEVDPIICNGIVGTCNCFGRICESRGLSNLTPARSRLFKLIEKRRCKAVDLQRQKHIWWLTCANESEKRSNGTDVI